MRSISSYNEKIAQQFLNLTMNRQKSCNNLLYIFLGLAGGAIFTSACLDTTGQTLMTYQFAALLLVLLIFVFLLRRTLTKDYCIWAVITGCFLKLAYIYYTPVWLRQHDVIDFGYYEGHAAYIEYILNNHRLPDCDPRSLWGFFQPPLHHIIAAAWMYIQRRLNVGERLIEENVQVLTLIYMCVAVIMAYLICKELNMKKRGMLITMLIVSFHPIFIILSGSINNDALALCLCMMAAYVAILWYKKPCFATIIILAFLVGLAMFAKLSSALMAPAVGALMLTSLIKNKDKIKNYILQFIVFGVIVFPIGLYWSVRNMIKWDMPLNYIPEVGEQLEHTDIVSRLFDIRMHSVYPSMIALGDTYDEYNTILQMLKSSLFGEYNYGQISAYINPFSVILFIVSALLALICLWATVTMIFDKKSMLDISYKLFFGILYASFTAGYFAFSLGYSNFSAQDFRYSAIAIIIEAIFLGLWADEREDKVARPVLWLCMIFAVSSSAVYLLIGIL